MRQCSRLDLWGQIEGGSEGDRGWTPDAASILVHFIQISAMSHQFLGIASL